MITLSFPGKSGQEWESEIKDADLAALLRVLKRRGPKARLLAFKDEAGWHPLGAEDINDYVRERTGGDFTSKDFRTLRGSIAAAVSLARTGPQRTPTARKRAESSAVKDAAEVLGNTPRSPGAATSTRASSTSTTTAARSTAMRRPSPPSAPSSPTERSVVQDATPLSNVAMRLAGALRSVHPAQPMFQATRTVRMRGTPGR